MKHGHLQRHGWIVRIEYCANNGNKSDRKGQGLYDVTRIWVIKLKATNEQTKEANKHTLRNRQEHSCYQREVGAGHNKGKGGQIYG